MSYLSWKVSYKNAPAIHVNLPNPPSVGRREYFDLIPLYSLAHIFTNPYVLLSPDQAVAGGGRLLRAVLMEVYIGLELPCHNWHCARSSSFFML